MAQSGTSMESSSFSTRFHRLWIEWCPPDPVTDGASNHARDSAFAKALQSALRSDGITNRHCSYKTIESWRKGGIPRKPHEVIPSILKVALGRIPQSIEVEALLATIVLANNIPDTSPLNAAKIDASPAMQRCNTPPSMPPAWIWIQDFQRNPTDGLAHMTLHVPAAPNNDEGTVPFRITLAFGSARHRVEGETYVFQLRRAFVVESNIGMERQSVEAASSNEKIVLDGSTGVWVFAPRHGDYLHGTALADLSLCELKPVGATPPTITAMLRCDYDDIAVIRAAPLPDPAPNPVAEAVTLAFLRKCKVRNRSPYVLASTRLSARRRAP